MQNQYGKELTLTTLIIDREAREIMYLVALLFEPFELRR